MKNPNFASPADYIQEASRLAALDASAAGCLLEQAVERFPQSADLLAHLGFYYYKTGRYSRAIGAFQRFSALALPDAGICALMAEMAQARRDSETALLWLQRQKDMEGFSPTLSRIISRVRRRIILQKNIRPLWGFLLHPLILLYKWILTWLNWLGLWFWDEMNKKEGQPFQLSRFIRFLMRFDPLFWRESYAYHKTREAILASNTLAFGAPRRLLDIGTGKNLLPLYWASQGCDVTIMDGSFYGFSLLRHSRNFMNRRAFSYSAEFAMGDARRLPFADNVFDGVSALCVIEHIPADGDAECMREIFRVLRPGGRAIVTVETSAAFSEQWMEVPYEIGYQAQGASPTKTDWEEVFCRNYSPAEMMNRLAAAAPWRVVEIAYYDDGVFPIRRWLDPFRSSWRAAFLRPLQPLLSATFYRNKSNENLTPSSIGCLILEKPL
ncbi:MAG: methyltransferase domain-containing protein [Candidatus Omnitrophota bacterium]